MPDEIKATIDIEYVKQWLDDFENLEPVDYWKKYENGDMEDVPCEIFVRTCLTEIERLQGELDRIRNNLLTAQPYLNDMSAGYHGEEQPE